MSKGFAGAGSFCRDRQGSALPSILKVRTSAGGGVFLHERGYQNAMQLIMSDLRERFKILNRKPAKLIFLDHVFAQHHRPRFQRLRVTPKALLSALTAWLLRRSFKTKAHREFKTQMRLKPVLVRKNQF
jgi:hypothetical protein